MSDNTDTSADSALEPAASAPATAAPKTIQTDVLCVGAGPASLATALSLLRTLKARGVEADKLPRVTIVEKSRRIGNHVLSGAVIDPAGFAGLLTEKEIAAIPIEARVSKESFYMLLGKQSHVAIPWVPPLMRAHGYPVGSLTKLTQYLAQLCEKEGAEIYTGFAVTQLIEDAQGRITGAKIGAKGLARDGTPKSNHLPEEEVSAKVVILGEGACGILTDKLIKEKNLHGSRPQSYALGIKEVLDVPADETRVGEILHTFGHPANLSTYGGGFVYRSSPTQVLVCYACALDYTNPTTDPHTLFRQFKAHPAIAAQIKGGKSVAYGAKVIPEGGFYSVPKVVADGALIVGDGAGLVDTLRIKGVHIALQAGAAAAATLADCWQTGDFSRAALAPYTTRLQATTGWRQLKRVKNVRAPFSKHLVLGVASVGYAWLTNGLFPFWRVGLEEDHATLRPRRNGDASPAIPPEIVPGPTSPDRLTDVFMSGTIHDEDQPCHLKIKDRTKCAECIEKYDAPCQRFCPAEVYRLEDGVIHVDFSNCLHCKTCQIKDPYQNIVWNFPQGGDGPRYTRM
ncbi:MAG: electron transfer flavoprotein-ubiquinone oxidoreductase [Puniceicoccales bacterium]|jgi:electron-transferring-flavoprotein dehydrogenase|nr:electron transfer flavoprotein-ubiquinone oxidoreductase [Puniceicoccales bacterium]